MPTSNVTYKTKGESFTNPVFGGLNFEYDMFRPEGSRAVIHGFANGRDFDLNKTYIVGVNNYHLGNAGCGFGKYSTADAIWSQTDDMGGGVVQDLIMEFFRDQADNEKKGVDPADFFTWKWELTYSGAEFALYSTTDIHGKCWDVNVLNDTKENNNLLRVATVMKGEREIYNENVILVDNGDLYQGTPVSTYQLNLLAKGESDWPAAMALCLSEIGYDMANVGNHEFNYGWELMTKVRSYMTGRGVASVCANLYYDGTDGVHEKGRERHDSVHHQGAERCRPHHQGRSAGHGHAGLHPLGHPRELSRHPFLPTAITLRETWPRRPPATSPR